MREGIAIAGTVAVDEIKKVRKYPNSSELATIQRVSRSIGGAVSNCAVGLAKMDHELPIEVIALVGKDEKGLFIQDQLATFSNINTKQVHATGVTPFTDVIQDLTDHSRTFFTYRGNSHLFNENTIDFKSLQANLLHIAYILLLDSLDQVDDEYGTKMAKVLKQAQEAGIKTSIDIVSESGNRYSQIVPPSLAYTNYCVVNELEAGKTVGIELRDQQGNLKINELRKVLVRLKELGVQDWVVIHTPEGSFGFDGLHVHSIPSLAIEQAHIQGTVGAGDAYVSGVLYGALKGMELPQAMELGTAAAASSLLAEDSTSGIKPIEQLMNMYQQYAKRETIEI
ncbi:carbohydrate kinase family protein [Bacillus horti]|uniref:Sugar/nucleoside kinase (Ribokinase family) n=1 Tax=Caldalkalibacillus horti TaxID=77523 RepID=A0ABT9W205_9BACI|nr:carbohydrate kinase family protein [Bacillus horti]MDQ0167286.1 sugar/nucleoside kinase (ribokinase family) [Bacillus horti]